MRYPANVVPLSKLQTPKQRLTRRNNALKNERSTWLDHWRLIAQHIDPWSAKFESTDANKGTRVGQDIINGTPVWALGILASGMMAGITSPARPWFRLTTPDPDLAEYGSVKEWLHIVEERIRQSLNKSNVYNALHGVYGQLGSYGISSMYLEEDSEDTLRAYLFPIGQYALDNSARLRVNSVYREFRMTVSQLVERFGLENCSLQVKSMHANEQYEEWVSVLHVIEPNKEMAYGRADKSGKPFRSCWMEIGRDAETQFLHEGGYDEFPLMVPRWQVSGEDVYGISPGMKALGDCRALQHLEKRKAQAVDKIVTPPMVGPATLQAHGVSLLPGGVTYLPSLSPGDSFRPAVEVNPNALPAIMQSIQEHEMRIKRFFFADLWLDISGVNRPQMTAREVAERHEEKMLQLGPVMERLQDELLDPLISRCFGILYRNGMLPDAPEELAGQDMRIEYISVMAQAQKMLGITGVERLASFTGSLAAASPSVLDKLDMDQMVDEYANMLGVPPRLVRTDEDVAAMRAKRQEAADAQQAMQSGMAAATAAKTLSQADTGSDNALSRLMGGLGGVAAAAGPGTVQ